MPKPRLASPDFTSARSRPPIRAGTTERSLGVRGIAGVTSWLVAGMPLGAAEAGGGAAARASRLHSATSAERPTRIERIKTKWRR